MTKLASSVSDFLFKQIYQEPQREISKIDNLIIQVPDLKQELENATDYENKLFTLLSYDPILIDPRLYTFIYNEDIPVNESMKRLLIKRLIFHKQFRMSWHIFLTSYNSISDLDDYLELIKPVVNDKFSFIDFILSIPEVENNFFNQIVNSISFVFKQSIDLFKVIEEWSSLNTVPPLYDEPIEYYIVHLKKLITLNPEKAETYLLKFPKVLDYPGWTLLLPTKTTCLTGSKPAFHLINHHIQKLNDLDTINVLDSVDPNEILRLTNTNNKTLINLLATKVLNQPTKESINILYNKLSLLNEQNVIPVCKLAISNDNDITKIPREHITKFAFTPNQYHKLIFASDSTTQTCRELIHSYSEKASLENFHQLILLAGSKLRKQTLLEIFRGAMLRGKYIDRTIIIQTFQNIIDKLFTIGDFDLNRVQKMEKNSFHHSIASLTQTISLLPPRDISKVIDILIKYINSSDFAFDQFAKTYLIKRISEKIFQFIIFTTRKNESLEVLQTIMNHLESDSTNVQKWIYIKLIMDDYTNVFKLIDFYHKNKLTLSKYHSSFSFGLIKNQQLDLNQKFAMLDKLQQKYHKLGLTNKLSSKHCGEIARLIIITKKKNQLDENAISWFQNQCDNNKAFKWMMNKHFRNRNLFH